VENTGNKMRSTVVSVVFVTDNNIHVSGKRRKEREKKRINLSLLAKVEQLSDE